MYEAYFGLSRRPFASVPEVDQYFPGTAIEAARQTLVRCLQRGEGAGMVVGPSGTGKTLLCQLLAEQLKDQFRVALLSSGRLSTRRALYQAIRYELGQPYRGMYEGELRLGLIDYLTVGQECPNGMLLLVDEAHTLPLRLLEEIRMLTNLAGNGKPRVRLALAGGCALEERFANPKLDSFSQRLVARCYLESFNRTQTQEYIQAQMQRAGGSGKEVFPAETCQGVYQATDGVPRLINQVCDHALLLAYAAGQKQLAPRQIEEAWSDLQQLPTPWNGESSPDSGEASVIEVGGLDDSYDPAPPPAAGEESDTELPDTVPALRISPDPAEMPPHCPEPAEQLERIEGMLADAEEEFQPAGSIGPEVELVFPESLPPFDEPFPQEEIVSDRYGRSQKTAGEQSPPAPRAQLPEPAGPAEPAEPADSAETDHAEDADMVVVEDDDDDGCAPSCPIVAARRQEYGRLFAKLRRG